MHCLEGMTLSMMPFAEIYDTHWILTRELGLTSTVRDADGRIIAVALATAAEPAYLDLNSRSANSRNTGQFGPSVCPLAC
jgi:hypothetical protein